MMTIITILTMFVAVHTIKMAVAEVKKYHILLAEAEAKEKRMEEARKLLDK